MQIQLFDINYISDYDRSPIINLFCLDEFGSNKIIKVHDFLPYFYVLSSDLETTKQDIQKLGLSYEQVLRFKPIGYQLNPVQMLKIYTTSPKDVRSVREQIKALKDVTNIYEADILFHDRFAADTGIMSFKWIEVESDNVSYKDIKILESQLEDVPLRILSLDIECLPPSNGSIPKPENDQITLISLAFNKQYRGVTNLVLIAKPLICSRPDIISYKNEHDMLEGLIYIINDSDPDVLTGYNVVSFDLNYLNERMKIHNIPCKIGRDHSALYIRQFGINKDAVIPGRVVIDTLPMVRKNFSLKSYTLKNVSQELLHLQKLDVSASEMREFWFDNGENFINFIKYSRRDAVLGLSLLIDLGMLRKYIALSKVSGTLLQTVVTSSNTPMLEFMILRRFNKINRVVNMKPQIGLSEDRESEFQGAYVSDPKKSLCEHLILTDMQSLYPSIIIRYNLCPTTLIQDDLPEDLSSIITSPDGTRFVSSNKGILPEMLNELLNNRLEIRKKMKENISKSEYEILDSIQYSYKILLNSAYGLCGYPRSRTFAISIASSVTAYGRETIKGVRNSIESIKDLDVNGKKFSFEVIYTDTDSAYVQLHCNDKITYNDAQLAGKKVTGIVSKPMSYPMKLNYEDYASRALFLAKKRYAMNIITKKDDKLVQKIKVKGIEVVRRDWCDVVGETMKLVLETILQEGDTNKAYKIAKDIIDKVAQFKDIRLDSEFAEKLVLTKKIGDLSKYKNDQPHLTVCKKMISRGEQPFGLGERCRYMAIPGALKDGISCMVDTPEFIIENGGCIDNEWYIAKQIQPPLERVFEAIGIDFSTGKKKQVASDLFGFSQVEKSKEIIQPKKTKTGLFSFT